MSPAQVALAWLLHQPGVTAPIVGATKIEHLEDALSALEIELESGGDPALEAPYGRIRSSGRTWVAPTVVSPRVNETCGRTLDPLSTPGLLRALFQHGAFTEITEALARRVPTHSSRAERGAGSRGIEECKHGGPVTCLRSQ